MASGANEPLLQQPTDMDHHAGDSLTHHGYYSVMIQVKPCIAEFFSTMVFVFIGTASCDTQDSLQIAAAHGLCIAMLVDQFVDISGGHMNPAVTIGVLLGNGSMHWFQAVFYILSQLSGAVTGAALTRLVFSFPTSSNPEKTHYESIHGGCTTLGKHVHPMQAIACEAIITFILVQTVLLLVTNKTIAKHHASLAIGFAVFVGITAGFGVTGGSMNPARSFGPAVMYLDKGSSVLRDHYVYWIGPMIGSLLAVMVFRLFFGDLHLTIWGKLFGSRMDHHLLDHDHVERH